MDSITDVQAKLQSTMQSALDISLRINWDIEGIRGGGNGDGF